MSVFINSSSIISPIEISENGNFKVQNIASNKPLKCIEPNYKTLINPRRLRRMSRMLKMGIYAAKQALQNAQIPMPDAIITGTGMGCMEDTEKFLSSVNEQNEGILSPTPFIQSTHNTVSSAIALELKCHHYNSTYVHRGFSFESALLDGMLFCEEDENSNVLIGGIDEIIEPYFDITNRMKLWEGKKVLAGEGAAFFTISNEKKGGLAEILDIKTFSTNPESEILEFLEKNRHSSEGIDLICLGQNQNPLTQEIYDSLIQKLFSKSSLIHFKHLCGEYKTASSFGLWLATHILKSQTIPEVVKLNNIQSKNIRNILIYNNYQNINHSLILLQNA